MAWALRFDGVNDRCTFTPTSFHQNRTNYRLEILFTVYNLDSSIYFVSKSNSFGSYISVTSSKEFRLRYAGSTVSWDNIPIDLSTLHELIVTRNGSVHELFVDGVSQGTQLSSATSTETVNTIGRVNTIYSNYDLQYIHLYDDYTGGAGITGWDAEASDHSNTGQQPVLVDIFGSNNATGSGFPTDGSAWIDLGGGGVDGTVFLIMSPISVVSSGNVGESINGSVNALMSDLLITGSGTIGDNPTGIISINMSNTLVSSFGVIGESVLGFATPTMDDAVAIASGNVGQGVSGSVSLQFDDFTINGEGTFSMSVTGTAGIQMDDFTIYGRESDSGGGIYGVISVVPIEIEEINAIPIEVITK